LARVARATLFPYTTLFRSPFGDDGADGFCQPGARRFRHGGGLSADEPDGSPRRTFSAGSADRSHGCGGGQSADRAPTLSSALRRRRAGPGAADDGAGLHVGGGRLLCLVTSATTVA